MRRTLALTAALALLAAFTVGGAALADTNPDQCQITNKVSHGNFDNLQESVDAAAAGDTLHVKGTCHGTTTIDKDLTIKGKGRQATLDGDRGSGIEGSVVTVEPDVEVTIARLIITNGYNTAGGGGIYNRGTVTLDHSTVSGSGAYGGGGGIENDRSGTMMLDHSTVVDNGVRHDGGGIRNSGMLRLDRSTVSENRASDGGGIYNSVSGKVTLDRSTINGNSAERGGGILNDGSVMVIRSAITGNTAYWGGGVASIGTVTLERSTVTNNEAGYGGGGGIGNYQGTVTLDSSRIAGNFSYADGGGISNAGTVMLLDSTITGNEAGYYVGGGEGGGIINHPGSVVSISDSTISGNTPNDCFAAG